MKRHQGKTLTTLLALAIGIGIARTAEAGFFVCGVTVNATGQYATACADDSLPHPFANACDQAYEALGCPMDNSKKFAACSEGSGYHSDTGCDGVQVYDSVDGN